jgi:hypothetical protein
MRWRRLLPGEFNHELVWLLVFVGAALVGFVWIQGAWITPKCTWHELTGIPCVGCGGTRCVRYLLQGDWLAAVRINPLIFLTLGAVALYCTYAAVVIAFRFPRLRFAAWPEWANWSVRIAAVLVLIANWAWLIMNRV